MGYSNSYKAIFFDVNKAREKPTTTDALQDAELSKPDNSLISNLNNPAAAAGGGWFSKNPSTQSSTTSKSIFKIGGEVAEDRRMTKEAFNSLIQQMVPLQGDLCPQKGKMANPFNNNIMPDLSCPGLKMGGRRMNKTKKHGKSKKRYTRRH
jgi:hypothetical protein